MMNAKMARENVARFEEKQRERMENRVNAQLESFSRVIEQKSLEGEDLVKLQTTGLTIEEINLVEKKLIELGFDVEKVNLNVMLVEW